jgi:hypothetical protein
MAAKVAMVVVVAVATVVVIGFPSLATVVVLQAAPADACLPVITTATIPAMQVS